MPKDTPPPIPRNRPGPSRPNRGGAANANHEPLGRERLQDRDTHTPDLSLPAKPVVAVQKVYESAPQVRDLRKEATQKFVPSIVKRKIDASKGKGRLLEEEELERLEKEGYGAVAGGISGGAGTGNLGNRTPVVNPAPMVDEGVGGEQDDGQLSEAQRRLEEEEEMFAREMAMAEAGEDENRNEPRRGVTMEDVEDEDL